MTSFISFLMLTVPGIVAICIHDKKLIKITGENWQSYLWKYLFYSFAIVFAVYFVMFLTSTNRTVSFSASNLMTTSSVLQVGFVIKYSIFAIIAAWFMPKVWARFHVLFDGTRKHKKIVIGDDE